MKELEVTWKLVIPLEGDIDDDIDQDIFRRGIKDFMFSGAQADFTLRTRAMMSRRRKGHYKSSRTYKPGVYSLAASMKIIKFGTHPRA